MDVRSGVPASPGIASAPAFVLEGDERAIPDRHIEAGTADLEVERLERGLDGAATRLEELLERLKDRTAEVRGVLDAHLALLRDPALREEATRHVHEDGFSPEWAISSVIERHAVMLRSLGDSYLAQRVADLHDIRRRILQELRGEREEVLAAVEGKVIVVARDLTPTQTASLDRDRVAGFVTDEGGPTSHTAIIARSLGIPAVVGAGDLSLAVRPGMVLVVDGSRGRVVLEPDRRTLRRFSEISASWARHRIEVEHARSLPAETLDGQRVTVLANVEIPSEVAAAIDAGAEGIGLYRTEFLVRPGAPLPTEDEHFAAYREALEGVGGRPLVIRTLDVGADKVNPDPEASSEANPFLGRRSLRLCLQMPELFRPQVRAILRASALGDVRVMLPMVSSVDEVIESRRIFEEERERLAREGEVVPADLPLGVMIEVPSAALSADLLARHVSFMSIGTNDLIQYCLAVDRVNPRVAHLYQPTHPAVLRLISRVIRAARSRDVDVSVCGEMSGEPLYAFLLAGMGVRTLSMNAHAIPEVKQVFRSGTMESAWNLAEEIRGLPDAVTIEERLRQGMRGIVPVLF